MNLLEKEASIGDKKLNLEATLNPNAAEFVPSALRSQAARIIIPSASSKIMTSSEKSMLYRSESLVSTNSEEDAQQYWCHQLPDDITPDFKVIGIDNTREISGLSFSNLSLTDSNEGSRHNSSTNRGFMLQERQGLSHHTLNGHSYAENPRFPVSSYGQYPSPTSFQPSLAKPWEKQAISNDHRIARKGLPYNDNSSQSFLADMPNEQLLLDHDDVGPLEFLSSQFPGFATKCLAEVYFANGGDLNLTIEVLAQIELLGDGGFNQILNSKAISSPTCSALDSSCLFVPDGQNGLAKLSGCDHQNLSPYQSSTKDITPLYGSFSPSRGAAPARKMASSQDSSIWKYEINGSSGASIGSSRSSQVLASSYNNNAQGKGIYDNRLLNRGSAHASPFWLDSGEAVAHMHPEIREEARDHARLHYAFFEQARQAYLIGNKALAKELSIKGQFHNMKMKAAHEKAPESIYPQRDRERERIINLHGLGVSEAIHVVKRELAILRSAARSTDQCVLVYICVGMGPRTPARLPTAVQWYLLKEERLDYSEPQPGVLRVVVF